VAVVTATSKITTSVNTAGVTSTVSAGGGHGSKKGMGIEGIAMSFLGIVGFVAGML
jgi:hypothetical protein